MLSLASVLSVSDEVTATVVRVALHKDKVQVQVSLPDVAVPPITEQLADAGIQPGQRLTGRIDNVNSSLGLFVEVPEGQWSRAPKGASGWNRLRIRCRRADRCRNRHMGENPRKPGQANIGLRLVAGGWGRAVHVPQR